MAQYTKNKDGYYRKIIVTGYETGKDGKPHQKRQNIRSKSLTEFKQLVREAENLRDKGYDFDSKDITAGEWIQKWFKTYKEPNLRYHSIQNYKSNLKLHILPIIDNIKLMDIKPYKLQEILNAQKGKSKSNTQKILFCIRQIFRKAYENGMIVKDVSVGLTMPLTTKSSRRPLTESERAAIIKVAETHQAGLWVLTMLYCGLRPEETVSLMWHDFDFTEGKETVTVKRAAEWVHNKAQIKGLKGKDDKTGKEAERTIPIPQPLAEKLKATPHVGLYVFSPEQSDGMLSQTNVKRLWHSFHRTLISKWVPNYTETK